MSGLNGHRATIIAPPATKTDEEILAALEDGLKRVLGGQGALPCADPANAFIALALVKRVSAMIAHQNKTNELLEALIKAMTEPTRLVRHGAVFPTRAPSSESDL